MRTPGITAIASSTDSAMLDSVLSLVKDSWPLEGEAPFGIAVTSGRVLQDPDLVNGVALIVADNVRDTVLYKLIDMLEPRLAPILVVTPAGSGDMSSVLGQTVLSVSVDSDPLVIATMLSTLVRQLPYFNELYSEIRVSQRYQGGLRQEMGLLHEEMQLAGRIQREFLPDRMPEIDGVGFDVLFRPCGYVSGDIYDVKRVDEHRVGFVLADAVGHGVPAALMTMILTRALPSMEQGLAEGSLIEPSAALHRLNEVMIRGGGDNGRFATGVYGVIDVRTHEVTLAGAGHPPPLIISPDGVRAIETEGPLLGIFKDAEFPQVTFSLEPGELLMLYSDGFETAFPSSASTEHNRKLPTELYIDHFVSLAQVVATGGVREARERLESEIEEQAGSLHQVDDLTALLVAPTERAASAVASDFSAAA